MILMGVAFYMALMLVIGYVSSKKVKNLSDFLVAGRSLPFPMALATLFATWFGAGSCMGAAGTAFSDGILGVIADPFAAGVSLIIAGFFYVQLLRRLKLLTVIDVFGKYYSKNSEIFASILMIPVYIGWLGSQMVALGFLLNFLTGINPTLGIIIAAIIVVSYTYAGGMWAVTFTDIIQVLVLVSGLFLILPFVLNEVGGLSNLVTQTPKEFWHFLPQNANYDGWMAYAGQWALLGLGTVVGQDLIQRSLSSKNETIAKTSSISAGVLYILIGFIPILLGFSGRLLFPSIVDPELIIPTLATEYLPPILMVLFVGALISAIMSSADSSLLAATSLLTHNVVFKFIDRGSEENELRWTRIATIILAILSMFVALYVQQIYTLMVNTWATLFVAILVPVTAALYWNKANTPAAWVSMILGTGTWIGFILLQTGSFLEVSDELFSEAAVYGGLASLISYVLVTLFRYSKIPLTEPAIKLNSSN